MARRMDLLNQITRQLSVLATEIALENRSNRMTLNSDVETIYCGFVNRLCGWELGNLNEEAQNFPGIDLADRKRGIAVQITASATNEKVKHTLKTFFKYNQDRQFRRLILLITTDRPIPGGACKLERPFDFEPGRDIWNVEVMKRKVEAIEDAEHLQTLADYLDSQLGLLPGPQKPEHLLPPIPAACEGFLEGSRDGELEILEQALQSGNPVFIWGLGGMGKSQTAIQLANRCAGARGAYFLRYAGSMRETVRTAIISGYRLEARGETDHEVLKEQEYREKLEILRREYENTILVIDNFNIEGAGLEQLKAEPACQDVLALENQGVRLIFTTRYDPGTAEWEIGPMEDDRLVELMKRYCTDGSVSEEDMVRLIRAAGSHTLMVELIAKTLAESWNEVTPEQVLAALAQARLDRDDFPDVASDKDGLFRQEQIYHHIRALFDLSGLSDGAERVLSLAPLMAAEGLDDLLFRGALEAADGKELQNLVKRGWLQRTDRIITIHPAICQVVRGELCPAEALVQNFMDRLWERLQKKEYGSDTLRRAALCMGTGAGYISDSDVYFDVKKRTLSLWEQVLPGDSVELAQVYSDMGGVYMKMGDYSGALMYKSKALGIKKYALPPEDPALEVASDLLKRVQDMVKEVEGDYEVKFVTEDGEEGFILGKESLSRLQKEVDLYTGMQESCGMVNKCLKDLTDSLLKRCDMLTQLFSPETSELLELCGIEVDRQVLDALQQVMKRLCRLIELEEAQRTSNNEDVESYNQRILECADEYWKMLELLDVYIRLIFEQMKTCEESTEATPCSEN